MIKVGLTGGYATGKSFVASELEKLGCQVIYADRLGHAVLEPEGEAYASVVESFGREILSPDGAIDRQRLGAIVFHSAALLEKLNSFVHPAVFRLEEDMFRRFAEADPEGIAVLEAAILIETGRYKVFDRLILTVCAEELQLERGMSRNGLMREQVLARLRNQMPAEEKKRYADYVIDTSSSKENTIQKVEHVYRELRDFARKSA